MSAGLQFGNASVSSSYSQEITSDTTQTMETDISASYTTTCTGQVGSAGGVGFWQFVVYSADEFSYVNTQHTVCRYGSLYNKAPACPWNACSNGDCSICEIGWETANQDGESLFLQ